MSSEQIRLERRATQRFEFHTPVTIRLAGADKESYGFTQDLSGRGTLLYTDLYLREGDAVEVMLLMPSEITLAESMRVRCRGRVVRISRSQVGTKSGVAVHFEGGYEFLAEANSQAAADLGRFQTNSEAPAEAGMSANVFHLRGVSASD
jgi:hypothetical protein